MNKEHQIYLAAGLVAAMGGVVYWRTQTDKQAKSAHAVTVTSADLPPLSLPAADVAAVTKLEVTNAGKGKVTLEKKGADWELTDPLKAKANSAHVKSLLDNLKEVKAKEIIDRTAATYPQYDLTDEKAVHVVAYKGGEKAIDIYFGKGGSRGQLVRLGGREGVFTAEKYSSFLYAREAKNWRDNSIFKVEEGDVTSIELENKNGKFVFTKSGEKWAGVVTSFGKDGKLNEKPDEKWEKYDDGKPKDLLRAWKSLTAVDFAEAKDDTGLDKPVENGALVKLTAKEKTYAFKVGKAAKGKDRYLVKDGSDGTVYVVSSWSADWAVADKAKFEKKDEKDKKKGKDKKDDGHGHDEPPEPPPMDEP